MGPAPLRSRDAVSSRGVHYIYARCCMSGSRPSADQPFPQGTALSRTAPPAVEPEADTGQFGRAYTIQLLFSARHDPEEALLPC